MSNTGARDGADVPQLYVTYPAVAEEPPRQLRFFTKVKPLLALHTPTAACVLLVTSNLLQVMLHVGESSELTMPLRLLPDLAVWSVEVRRMAAYRVVLFNSFDAIVAVQTHAFVQVAGTFIIEAFACSSSAVCSQWLQLKIRQPRRALRARQKRR